MSIERTLGRLLRPVRAGDTRLAWSDPRLSAPHVVSLSSPAFHDGGMIPKRFAGAGVGDNLSPPLAWTGAPAGAAELVLIVQDPDVPLPRPVAHLVAYGIDPGAGAAPEGAFGVDSTWPLKFGRGALGRIGWEGPRPVTGHGPHRYVFQMFALAHPLRFGSPPDLTAITGAMANGVLGRGKLTGLYVRP
jgi:Raf kinase inhibitor-like YbhB/YbcL family protein